MAFAIFAVFHQLAEWGWPRKKGLRRTPVVSEPAFFTAVSNTIQIMMGIGARFPEIGRALLKELTDTIQSGDTHILGNRDTTEHPDTEQTLNMLSRRAEEKIKRFGAQKPWESIRAMTFSEDSALVPITAEPAGYFQWDALTKNRNLIHMIGTWPAEGLLYALSNPEAVNGAFSDALGIGKLFGTLTFTLAEFDELCQAYVELYKASHETPAG